MHWQELVQTVISGALTGGASSATAILAIFRDIRNKISAIEERIGQPTSGLTKATGIQLSIEELGNKIRELEEKDRKISELLSKLQDSMHEWEDDPPEWLAKYVTRNRTSVNLELQQDFENRIENRFRSLQERISRELDSIESYKRRLDERYVSEETYQRDTRAHAEENATLRESLASTNGLLKGLLAANGIIDTEPQKKPKYG